jgi:hypothetical protein
MNVMSDTSVGSAMGGRVVPDMAVGIVFSSGLVVGIFGVVLSIVKGFDAAGVGDGTDES